MIFADPDEMGIAEKLGVEIVSSPQLEALTGADFVVSPLDIPFVPALLQRHIDAGCYLVQRKSGLDLSSSVVERLSTSLARMQALGAKQSQCVLVFVGVMVCDVNGEGKIDYKPIHGFNGSSFWIVQSAIEKWMERGGVYTNLSRIGLLGEWMVMKERHARIIMENPTCTVYETPDPLHEIIPSDPLQELVLVKDWRVTLASIKGIGKGKVESLITYINTQYEEAQMERQATLTDCILWMTNWELIKVVPGYGKGIYKSIRRWFGLSDGINLYAEEEE